MDFLSTAKTKYSFPLVLTIFISFLVIEIGYYTKLSWITSMKYLIFLIFIFPSLYAFAQGDDGEKNIKVTTQISLADPTIFKYNKTYYLYGTGGKDGFLAYQSHDLKNWSGPSGKKDGYALTKNESFGTKGFWAPQCFYQASEFYLFYTANEQIAVAKSNSPLGPFQQNSKKAIPSDARQIDPFVFIDQGKKYLYHVRLDSGNRIFVAELTDDLSTIKTETLKECIAATEPWENTANAPWPVAEGPTVIKHKDNYYLFYSANDFRNIDYAVGYAVSKSPLGPWRKFNGNPIISRHNTGKNGTGHGDLIQNDKGEWIYVLHVHSNSGVSPRVAAMVKLRFVENAEGPDIVVMEPGSFFYLNLNSER